MILQIAKAWGQQPWLIKNQRQLAETLQILNATISGTGTLKSDEDGHGDCYWSRSRRADCGAPPSSTLYLRLAKLSLQQRKYLGGKY
jgi:hypothetical protein